ncbi:MAG: serine hydrolase domain-containing protein [Bacteroidota bacterium]
MRNFFITLLLFVSTSSNSQPLYFPPLVGNTWDTISPASLGWCTGRIDSLYNYLDQQNSKAFIILKDGKIVLEKYFGTFTQDSLWYWASAGKTITSFLVGKAQEQNYLSLSDTSSKYLDFGWTNCTRQQEDSITIRHQVTMTTGLDDGVTDNHCTDPACLIYKAATGSRWAYHNAPYTLLERVITQATAQNINLYTQSALKTRTGITGAWVTVGYDNVYYSKPRSMARFGLFIQNNCVWNNDTLLYDTGYKKAMINTSQQINYAYGYLWWLNGKGSYMVPSSQLVIPGSYAPSAPADMYAAIGKNGQIVSVSPSKGLVVVRMGNADEGEVPFLMCDNIWQRLNYVMCNSTPPTTYTFIGNGNWSIAANWSGGNIPPAVLPAGDQIVIYPFANGECVLNVNQIISSASSLFVVANKKLRVTGNLLVQ